MEERQSLEQAINSDHRIAVLQTNDSEQYLGLFKRLTLTTGRAIYDWNPEHGLYRLGMERIFIPRTRAPADVLAYIASSRHYGIYLLRDFEDSLSKPVVERQLVKFAEKQDGVKRLVFLMGKTLTLPASLTSYATHVRTDVQRQNAG